MVVIVGKTRAPRGHWSTTPLLGCHGTSNRCAPVQRCVRSAVSAARQDDDDERTKEDCQAEGSIQVLSFQASTRAAITSWNPASECVIINGRSSRIIRKESPHGLAYEWDHDSKEVDIISMMRVSRALKGGLGRMQ